MSRWGQDELLKVAGQMLESDESRIASVLGRNAIARFMRRQRSDNGFSTYQVWALAMLESWLRHHPARLEGVATVALSADRPHDVSQILFWEIAEGVLVAAEGGATLARHRSSMRLT